MDIEKPSSRPKKDEEKKERPKTRLYTPFDKETHKKKMSGVKIDIEEGEKEEEIQLDALEKDLNEVDAVNKKLVERFKAIYDKMKPGKLWTKVNVSGEEHTIVFSHLERKGLLEEPSEAMEKVEKEGSTLSALEIQFNAGKIAGRAETLLLSYKVPLSLLLQGGGEIEDELHTLVTEQFAGTKHYYDTIREQQAEIENPAQETEEFRVAKAQIHGSLEKRGAVITEVKGGKAFTFIAQLPESSKQLHITSVDKKVWSVAVTENQNLKKEEFNLRPQEVISSHIEWDT